MALSGTPNNQDEYDALAEARRAARRAGMSLGEWLDVVVEGRAPSARHQTPPRSAGHASTEETIAAIRARLDEFARRHGRPEDDQPERRASLDIARRLEDRLDALVKASRGLPSERDAPRTDHPHELLGTHSAPLNMGPESEPRPAPAAELKDAIAEIASRQRALEQEFEQAMAGYSDRMDHRLDRVAERLERRIEEASPVPAVRDLEEELRAVAARIADDQRSSLPDLRGELSELARRLEALPPRVAEVMAGRLEDTARRLDTATRGEVDSIRAEMREIAQEIDRVTRSGFEEVRSDIAQLMARMSQSAPSNHPIELGLGDDGRAELASLRDDIRALASQLEGNQRESHASLLEELRELARRVDARAPDRLHELERHLDLLVERIGREPAGIDNSDLAEIERQIARLGDRFEATPGWLQEVQGQLDRVAERVGAAPSAPGRDELAEIERQIARLADRLDAEGESGGDLAGIERKISELTHQLDGSHVSDGAITSLKDEFAALKANVDQANERSMAALGAVHDTLNRIVDRIANLEAEIESVADGARRPTPALPEQDTPPPPRHHDSAAPEPELGADDIIGRIEAVTRSFKAESDDHTPLAPGSGPPAAAAATTEEPSDLPRASRDDFIAAARRAAQAATAEAAGQPAAEEGALRGSSLLARLGAYRRPLLIAAAIGLLIVGALKLADIMSSRNAGSAPQPAVEDSAAPPVTGESGAAADTPQPATPATEPATDSSLPPAPRAIELAEPRGVPITTGSTVATDDVTVPQLQSPTMSDSVAALPGAGEKPVQNLARTAEPAELPAAIGSERLRQAAAEGNAAAQFEIAARYTDGRGVAQDLAKAAHWYRLAAAQGLAPAQYRLGGLYEKGHGVPRDLAMARTWYQRAAEQGNRTAMHNLAVLYAEGVNGEPDYEQAALWFRQSSEYGLKDSQYNLGILHARGLGVEANLVDSYRWFSAAAEQGDAEAAVQRDEIARRLEPDALAAAELATQSWRPKPVIEEANRVPVPSGGWDEAPPDRPSDPEALVREAQALLDRLGYAPGPVDGQLGAMTRRAVVEFQRAAGLPETGEITPDLLDHLNRQAG